ncbi:hypothetical protein [Pseudomonas sp. S2_H01]
MSDDPLADWRAAIKARDDLITDPEGQRAKLVGLAMLAGRRHLVDEEELNEMIELSDAARLWALVEWEEAERIGLFSGAVPDRADGLQVIKGRG